MKRKLLTILLSLTMIMISMTNVVFADGEPVKIVETDVFYSSVQSAVDAATDGQTIRLIVDCNENVSIPQGKTVTIDLNGNVLSAPTTGGSVIKVNGNLTLADSNTESQHAGYVDENGLWHLGEIPQGANNCTEKNTIGGIITGGKGFFKSNEYLGGGVYVEENGTFVMNGGTIVGCSATKGGGVFTWGNFTMSNSSAIVNCIATVDGGGVCACNCLFIMNGSSKISNCSANNGGGGVYTWAVSGKSASFTMNNNSTIDKCRANLTTNTHYGGGVCVENSTFIMESGNIVENTASHGGGVSVESNAGFEMKSGSITTNTATVDGGGVYVYSGAFSMSKGTISNNTANTSGGGVYVWTSGNFTMSGGTISNNKANSTNNGYAGGGVCICGEFSMSGGTITSNKANTVGGGVDIAGGKFTMTGGTIAGNTAGYGGGIFVASNAQTNITNGIIENNHTTASGAGVQVDGRFTMTGGTIKNNKADGDGGGLSINGNTGMATLAGTTGIINNTANGKGGGVSYYNTSEKVILGGSVRITENVVGRTIDDGTLTDVTANNVYLFNDNLVAIGTGIYAPTDGMLVGITTYTPPTGTPVKFTTNGTDSDVQQFFSDNGNYKISFNNGTVASGDEYLELKVITIADILPDDFPNSAEKGWVNKDGAKVYKDDALNIIHLDCSKNLNSALLKVGNDYKLETNYTFIMTSGVLSSIKIEGVTALPPAKPNGEYVPYKYIEVPTPVNAGNTSNLVFKTNAYYNGTPSTVKVYIKLQGQSEELLDDDYYTLEQGSTKVTLKGSYVSTLPVGTHTITIEVNEYVPISQDFTIVAKPAPTFTPKPNKKPKYKAPSTGVDDI